MNKTNAMRLLERAGIPYRALDYPVGDEHREASAVAALIGLPPEQVFKTIVLRGERQGMLVCCLPANAELDLKKAAAAVGDKKVELLPMRELTAVTGYVRGGCSPIGMKKPFPTLIDETCILFDEITVSAGVRGCQVALAPEKLKDFLGAVVADICV